MSMMRTLTTIAALASLALPTIADDHEHDQEHDRGHRSHDAHVHGIAQLNVAVDADSLLVELDSPAMNLVGFEHPPHTDEERAAIAAAREQLADGAALFVPNAEAECVQISSQVKLELGEHDEDGHDKHEADHEDEHDHHADGHGEWAFTCANPVSLDQLDVRVFEVFPGTESLRVQLITSAGQRGAELTAEQHLLDL